MSDFSSEHPNKKYKLIHEFTDGEKLVDMILYNDVVFIASNHRVFKIVDDELIPLLFSIPEDI